MGRLCGVFGCPDLSRSVNVENLKVRILVLIPELLPFQSRLTLTFSGSHNASFEWAKWTSLKSISMDLFFQPNFGQGQQEVRMETE